MTLSVSARYLVDLWTSRASTVTMSLPFLVVSAIYHCPDMNEPARLMHVTEDIHILSIA